MMYVFRITIIGMGLKQTATDASNPDSTRRFVCSFKMVNMVTLVLLILTSGRKCLLLKGVATEVERLEPTKF